MPSRGPRRGRGHRLDAVARAAVERDLRRHAEWSDRAVGESSGASDKTVKRIREELQSRGEIEEYVGRGVVRHLSLLAQEYRQEKIESRLPTTSKDFEPVVTGMFTVRVTAAGGVGHYEQVFSLGLVRDGMDGWGAAVTRMANQLHKDPHMQAFWMESAARLRRQPR